MSVSDSQAPSWQGLLESMCDLLKDGAFLKESLFPEDEKNTLGMEEAAQVIAIELQKEGKSIHEEIAKEINLVELAGENSPIEDFLSKKAFRVVTTNYDCSGQ